MTKGRKTGGRDIIKGQVLNPNGRPKVPEHIKEARKMTQIKFADILYKHINSTHGELQDMMDNPETPALDMIVVKVLAEAIKHGDEKRLNFILDRTIGKVKEVREHHHNITGAIFDLKKLTAKELETMQELIAKCERLEE